MIQLTNIEKIYNKGKANEFQALYDVNLKIQQGEFIAITGKSGAGKSTLLHILGCIDSSTSGTYTLFNENIASLNDKRLSLARNQFFGFVMQDYALINHLSVYENIMLPALISKEKTTGLDKRIRDISEKTGIGALVRKKVNQLSGGERQRVAVARALINNPQILIADEPTGNLDSSNSDNIFRLFQSVNNDGVTVIIVTHDPELAQQFDRQIVVSDGRVVE